MDAFLTAVGKRITDHWLARVVVPGLLFVVAVTCAWYLGHAHALDAQLLGQRLEDAVSAMKPPTRAGITAAAVLSAAVAVAVLAHGAGRILERIWLGQWQGPLAKKLITLRRSLAQQDMTASSPSDPYLPARPTWIGDRIQLIQARIRAEYALEITLVWPRLWLLLDSDAREPVRDARDRFDATQRLAGWAILYLVLAGWWWPATPIAIVTFVIAWYRARRATADFADLVEATVDTHQQTLANALGVALHDGRITPDQADKINAALGKGHTAPSPALRWWRHPRQADWTRPGEVHEEGTAAVRPTTSAGEAAADPQ